MDQRLDVQHSRPAVDLANRANARNGSLAEHMPEAQSRGLVPAKRRRPPPFAAAESPERDLVDGGEEMRPANTRRNVLCRCPAVRGEAADETRTEWVEIVRVPV